MSKDEQSREKTITKWGLFSAYKESGLSSLDYMKKCFAVESMAVFRKRAKIPNYKNL